MKPSEVPEYADDAVCDAANGSSVGWRTDSRRFTESSHEPAGCGCANEQMMNPTLRTLDS